VSNGPKYVDDKSISDEEDLWRRLPQSWVQYDDTLKTNRVTSQAFQDSKDGTPASASIASENNGPEALLQGHDGYGIGCLTAGTARGCDQGITRHPEPDDPAHVYIFGEKTKTNKRCLAKGCNLIIVPTGSSLSG